ncbi:DUF4062 domain-containing protein [Rhodococcus sovatensis]|uniref:DUF4062 domain-containing protein n=1 Tax=Rhodococcus sovatensis TaxID=1805840 RepID=A0ABZ2PEQ1_9NOCA
MNHEPLLMDLRSASLPASDADVRAWASGRRVFVSSLITDMPNERAAVRAAIEDVGATPVMFEEELGAQDISAEQAYLAGVRSSAIYVGMWGPRYGVRMADGFSATHAEFLESERHGLRLCLFVQEGGDMDGHQRDLVQSARNLYTTSAWSEPDDLRKRVHRRLQDLAAEELAPWVRVGRAVFRSREITNDGRTVTIDASVHSDAVHSELVRLRDSRAGEIPLAIPGYALTTRVDTLSTRTVSTIGHHENLALTIQENRGSTMRGMTVNGIPAAEISRRALSDGLFGTALLSEQTHFFVQTPVDPLGPLRGSALDDAVLRPVARLLFEERLIRDQIASRVSFFAFGPSHQGARRLRASWTPPAVYGNEPEPGSVDIDGITTDL